MKTFSHECEYLIHLVRCAIHNLQPQEMPEQLSFENVYRWGVYHQVANIAFYSVEKLEKKPEPKLYKQWQESRDHAIIRDINQNFAATQIRDALTAAHIRWVEVQGTKIKPLYPQPEWRTMSDLDFIIDLENIPQVKEILENLGYQCEELYQDELNADRPPKMGVEMHTEFFLGDYKYRHILNSPFDHLDENGQCEPYTFYLYNILHIAKHYFFSGCGIRRVLDVYYLNQKYGDLIHSPRIQEVLKQAELVEFTAEFSSIADAWFGLEEQDFQKTKMVKYIINSGVHGSHVNEIEKNMEKALDPAQRHSKWGYILRRFLGNRQDLRTRYPVLERHPILYPFCWILRGVTALKPKKLKHLRTEVLLLENMEEPKE